MQSKLSLKSPLMGHKTWDITSFVLVLFVFAYGIETGMFLQPSAR